MKGKAMKLIHSSRETGSVLLATMIFVLAIAAFLVSYLVLVQNSNQTTARAQQWNSALALAEAGIEEGLANLNMSAISKSSNAISFPPIPDRKLNGGTYSVSSSAAGVVTTITSTGVVSAPITGEAITRIVQVTAQRQALFSKGVISMTYIDMNGNGIASDSYNSHDTNQSVNGMYVSTYYSGSNGDIAALGGIVNLNNHTINGDLYLGPNSELKNGTVTGDIFTDWNMQFESVSVPQFDADGFSLPWTPAPGGSSTHTFTNNGYYIIYDDSDIVVKPGVTISLDVRKTDYSPDTLTIMGGITNSATVIMYQNSGTLTLGGGDFAGAVNGRPENFQYFGGTNLTSIKYGGGSDFVGVIYAPQADMTLSGGGGSSGSYNFMGSFLVKSFTMNGHYNVHYDTSLEGLYWGLFVPGTWRELSPP